jgi:hypothetical protein
MEESEMLPGLLWCLEQQTFRSFHLFVCVNQPDSWWNEPERAARCLDNERCLSLLSQQYGFPVTVIDRSSRGKGWQGKQHGVGWARKTVMDAIDKLAGHQDVIVSIDADTRFSEHYLYSVALSFSRHPDAVAMSVPYYHPAGEDTPESRAILRYEIYMRYYYLNMHRIGSPYAFTALGSALAVRISAFRAIGGMTPRLSGEDFYFLQKLRKFGRILSWNEEEVYPAARFSDRVFFGTGPAMIRGAAGDWSSYPLYPMHLFDDILETTLILPVLFFQTLNTDVIHFMASEFREADPLALLRINHRTADGFARAFHEKFDGLRTLQYLKRMNNYETSTDEENLAAFFSRFYPEMIPDDPLLSSERFDSITFDRLAQLREVLYRLETVARIS